MKSKRFFLCTAAIMMIYLCGTLTYYTQIYILKDHYNSTFLTSFISGWNYLSQSAGIFLCILLIKYKKTMLDSDPVVYIIFLNQIPILALFVNMPYGSVGICMVFLSNILIGFQTAFVFSLAAKHLRSLHYGSCFAIAYALGGIGTWGISLINGALMSTYYILLPYSVLTAVTIGIILAIREMESAIAEETEPEYPANYSETSSSVRPPFAFSRREFELLCLIIVLMSVLTALGSNDPVLARYGEKASFLTTRIYYAVGLAAAGLLFDHNMALGGILACGAMLYQLMVIVLYHELPDNMLVIGLTDTFTGFYAVWRAGIFMRIGYESDSGVALASLGLCISRVVEGTAILLICVLSPNTLQTFLVSGLLNICLLVVFFIFVQDSAKESPKLHLPMTAQEVSKEDTPTPVKTSETVLSKEERCARFAERYRLTRREEEIAAYIAEHRSNGEISAILNISESTVRFHVSNILKKTEMKNRNELEHAFFRSVSCGHLRGMQAGYRVLYRRLGSHRSHKSTVISISRQVF